LGSGVLKCGARFALPAIAAAAFAGGANAAELGLATDLNWGTSQADQARTAGAIKDAGAKWVRLTVQWKYWEPNGPSVVLPETGSLHDTDRAVQLARGAGAKVLIAVYNAPNWAAVAPSSEGQVPKATSDFANFVRNLAARYRGQVAAYEIWNEPDLDRFWAGGSSPTAYTALLRAAYPAIKSADAAASVVFGGLSWDFSRQGSFLQRAYEAGAGGSFDVLAIHPYPDSDSDPTLMKWRTWFAAPRELMVRNGDGGKQMWFTEFGINTSTATRTQGAWQAGVSEQTQSTMLTVALNIAQGIPYVGVVVYYNFRNNYWSKDDPASLEGSFGLMRTDFSPKPAYAAFKAAAAGAPAAAVTAPPANDRFDTPQTLTGSLSSVKTTNAYATKEQGEPKHAGRNGGPSIWFSWTAPGTGSVSFDTLGSSFDTVLAVYTGSSVGALRAIASNDDAGGVQSKVTFGVTAGTVYRIAVDGTGGPPAQTGGVKLSWR
jgi:hypothetical protein